MQPFPPGRLVLSIRQTNFGSLVGVPVESANQAYRTLRDRSPVVIAKKARASKSAEYPNDDRANDIGFHLAPQEGDQAIIASVGGQSH